MVISAFWAKHLLSPNIQEACASEMKLVQTIRLFCLLLQTDKNTARRLLRTRLTTQTCASAWEVFCCYSLVILNVDNPFKRKK